eukprot:748391-Hanusia_phi.AAC.3
MGTTGSKLEKSLPSSFPDNERIFGLENVLTALVLATLLTRCQFGNTCYCNSVLQALYFCLPFREVIIVWLYASLRLSCKAVLDWARACVNSSKRRGFDARIGMQRLRWQRRTKGDEKTPGGGNVSPHQQQQEEVWSVWTEEADPGLHFTTDLTHFLHH